MKKLLASFFLFPFFVMGQVPNTGFEQLCDCASSLKNWGTAFMTAVNVDSTGQSISDSIVFDESWFSGSSANAHTGNFALELRNAYNETEQQVIPGTVAVFNDSESSEPTFFNNGVSLPAGSEIDMFGFYYKFLRVGQDTVRATMDVYGQNQHIGTVEFLIGQGASEYTWISAPLIPLSTEEPDFITIEFNMAAEGSQPAFGSRLLIDDISLNSSALRLIEKDKGSLEIWPTIAVSEIRIRTFEKDAQIVQLEVVSASGEVVISEDRMLSDQQLSVDVSKLNKGFYFVTVNGVSGKTTGKFIRQ